MSIKQSAQALWKGNLKEGEGSFQLPKGQYEGIYTHATRFSGAEGTNPEELIGAALASCFSMFLSATISKHNYEVDTIETNATVTLEILDSGPQITHINLEVDAIVENLSEMDFLEYVAHSKENCPISKLYQGTEISISANLNK